MNNMQKKYLAMGIGLGILFGIPLAISLENILFIGAGIPFGIAIAIALEKR